MTTNYKDEFSYFEPCPKKGVCEDMGGGHRFDHLMRVIPVQTGMTMGEGMTIPGYG